MFLNNGIYFTLFQKTCTTFYIIGNTFILATINTNYFHIINFKMMGGKILTCMIWINRLSQKGSKQTLRTCDKNLSANCSTKSRTGNSVRLFPPHPSKNFKFLFLPPPLPFALPHSPFHEVQGFKLCSSWQIRHAL